MIGSANLTHDVLASDSDASISNNVLSHYLPVVLRMLQG